VSCEFNERGH